MTREESEQAKQLMKHVSVIPEAICLAKSGATSIHDVTRGGLLETLLEIAALSDVGLKVEDDRIPMPSIVERFSEAFNFDPLKMISSGTLVATIPPSYLKAAKQGLDQRAIPFADIGTVVTGSGVDIVRGTEVQHYSDSRILKRMS